jgi:hypothetical protein
MKRRMRTFERTALPREYVLEYRALCREFDEICPDDTWIEMEKDLDDWAASIRDPEKS